MDICKKTECNKKVYAKGICKNHYSALWASKSRKNTPEKHVYSDIKQRCYNPKNRFYYRYGGRGITMCDRWLDSFDNFLEDMGKRPDNHSIDRIDNDGNYEPTNCRWADIFTQRHNQGISRRNKSGYVGVSFDARNNKWTAKTTVNKRFYWFGRFSTAEEANAAYIQGCSEL